MIRRWRKHPLDLHPGDPIVIEPHQVRDEKITRREEAVVDTGPAENRPGQLTGPELIRADMVRVYWHDPAGRLGVTIYHPAQWIHLRRTA